MNTLLDNPLFQSTLLPFAVVLVLAAVLGVLAPRWQGLALPLGFFPAAMLIAGMQLIPLTSTRKILVLGLIAVALMVFWRSMEGRWRNILLVVFITASVCWLQWPLLQRAESPAWMSMLGAGLFYMLWQIILFDRQRPVAVTQLLSISMFAAGVGVAAMIGASALLGQLGGALAAATAGLLLVVLVRGSAADTDMLVLPATLTAGLLGLAAVVYASLSWQSLLCLMLLPLVGRIPLTIDNRWLKLLLQLVLMFIVVAGAVYLAWIPVSNDAGENLY